MRNGVLICWKRRPKFGALPEWKDLTVFLDPAQWQNKIYIGGSWTTGSGGTREVIEPATGSVLASAGLADASDVARAAENAAEAQREWAAAPHAERAAVLR